jgi:hypothetical protein
MAITILLAITLVLLVWIGFTLRRLVGFVSTIQVEMRRVSTYPDSNHPAFSQAQIRAALGWLDTCAARSDQLQTELYQTTEWRNQPEGYVPSPDAESKMRDICLANACWYDALRRSQFMIEANLMAKRGELTIAEARRLYDDYVHASIGPLFGSGEPELREWKERLASKEARDNWQKDFEAKRADPDPRLKQLIQIRLDWEDKFERFKQYPPSMGSKPGGPERWFG